MSKPTESLDTQLANAIEKMECEIVVCEHNGWSDDVVEWKKHIAALTTARDFIASLPPSVNLRGASTPTDSTVAEALEIVDYLLEVDKHAWFDVVISKGKLEIIRATLLWQEARIKYLEENR